MWWIGEEEKQDKKEDVRRVNWPLFRWHQHEGTKRRRRIKREKQRWPWWNGGRNTTSWLVGGRSLPTSPSPPPPPLPQRDVIDAMPPAPWRLEHQPNLGLRFQWTHAAFVYIQYIVICHLSSVLCYTPSSTPSIHLCCTWCSLVEGEQLVHWPNEPVPPSRC